MTSLPALVGQPRNHLVIVGFEIELGLAAMGPEQRPSGWTKVIVAPTITRYSLQGEGTTPGHDPRACVAAQGMLFGIMLFGGA